MGVQNFLIFGSVASALSGVIVTAVYCRIRSRRVNSDRSITPDACKQQIMQAVFEAQEKERRKFAADLHDGAGSTLAAARFNLSLLALQFPDIAPKLEEAGSMVDEASESIRRISHRLMPAALERYGLSVAIEELCKQVSSVSPASFQYLEYGQKFELTKDRELMVFRMVQELVHNAIKHARTSVVTVTLNWGEQLIVEVTDNGTGFDFNDAQFFQGIGIYNVERRAALLGGEVKFGRANPTGTKVELLIPA